LQADLFENRFVLAGCSLDHLNACAVVKSLRFSEKKGRAGLRRQRPDRKAYFRAWILSQSFLS
jgi:hypothetical protein